MRVSALERATPRALAWLAVLLCCVVTGNAFGQLPTPTPEQLQLLNSLPPAQRQAILRELQNFQRQSLTGSLTTELTEEELLQGEIQLGEALVQQALEEEEPVRISPGDTIVVEFSNALDLPVGGEGQAEPMRQRLTAGNPYVLDDSGYLYLPGVQSIALGGLTTEEAQVRLEADAALSAFDMLVTLLPLEATGVEGLERFG